MLIKVNICYKISVRSKLFIGILDEENSDMLIPFLERGIMLLSLRSRYLRTGRVPKDLKIFSSKLFSLKFKCISLLGLDKQIDFEKKKIYC